MDVSCLLVFLMSNIWVSIPWLHLEDWGVWDSRSHRPKGTAPLLLSRTLLEAAQPGSCLVLLRNGACFQKNDIKLFTSSLGYISCRG